MNRSAPVLGALVAALLFAAGNNLQRHAAAADAHADAGPVRLFLRLLITPRWLLGGLLAVVALFFHARALTQGGVILVQSVIASTLVFAIGIEAVVERRRLRPVELVGSIVVVMGIALLVGIGKPGVSEEFRSVVKAVAVLAVALMIGLGALWLSHRRQRGRRTALLMGAAAGACFALDAVFLRAAAASLSPLDRPVLVLNGFGFAAASLLGNLVVARAFQSAPLRHVLPGLAAAEPITAFACGRLVFGEPLQGGLVGAVAVTGGLALMLVGVVLCAQGAPEQKPVIEAVPTTVA
ncbi:MAG: DMT family transporter [Kineosporiaceae bacterium]|nr:DMT family transporter [Kineosporiaceae bacterium]MBK7622484.1 DMT family transporter [Kineosporiaceae bacterium]MBK8078398.1 DMT family transporter [Kineosporiaceae bacterium]